MYIQIYIILYNYIYINTHLILFDDDHDQADGQTLVGTLLRAPVLTWIYLVGMIRKAQKQQAMSTKIVLCDIVCIHLFFHVVSFGVLFFCMFNWFFYSHLHLPYRSKLSNVKSPLQWTNGKLLRSRWFKHTSCWHQIGTLVLHIFEPKQVSHRWKRKSSSKWLLGGYLWATLAPSLNSFEVSPILAAAKLFPELLVPSFVKNSCMARVPPRLPCSQRRPGAFNAPWGKVGVACDSRFAHDLWIDRWNQNQCRCPM